MEQVTVEPSHIHHWVIEPPDGPTSPGVCRGCGEVRSFQNSLYAGKDLVLGGEEKRTNDVLFPARTGWRVA